MSQSRNPPREFLPALQRSLLRPSPFFDYIRFSDFKRLLGNIIATVDKNGIRSLAVLSANPQEGKTFMIAALALGYAVLLQKRVLIVNTVLDVPHGSIRIRKLYDEDLLYAAGDTVRGGHVSRMIDLISPQERDREKAHFDTVDFMIGKFLEGFRNEYDLILVDTCALTVQRNRVMDPVVIAGQTDAAVLVTSETSLNRESVTAVKGLLDQWKVRVIGAIHNRHGQTEKPRK